MQTRQLVVTYESNPNNIAEIRSRLNDASRDIISLEALLEYLKESLENLKIPPPPRDKDGCGVRQQPATDCCSRGRRAATRQLALDVLLVLI